MSSAQYDTSNNSSFVVIKPGVILPPDFIIDNFCLNRYRYIIQTGFEESDEWIDEYYLPPNNEMVALRLLGVHRYKPVRYRLRTDEDEPFDYNKFGILNSREKAFYQILDEKSLTKINKHDH